MVVYHLVPMSLAIMFPESKHQFLLDVTYLTRIIKSAEEVWAFEQTRPMRILLASKTMIFPGDTP